MKPKLISSSMILLTIVVCFLIFKIYKLEEENRSFVLQVKELQEKAGLLKNDLNSDEKNQLALAWQNNKGKWGVVINNNFFPLRLKPIYAFKRDGMEYETNSGLSFTPGDSSRIISTEGGSILIHPDDPRFFKGIYLKPVLQPVFVRQEITNEKY